MSKVVTLAQLKEHSKRENLWILIEGKVYDVTKFIDEHPGGDEVLLAEGGRDATESFDDVGHSEEARDLLPGLLVGSFDQASAPDLKASAAAKERMTQVKTGDSGSNLVYIVPLALISGYFAYRFYSTGSL